MTIKKRKYTLVVLAGGVIHVELFTGTENEASKQVHRILEHYDEPDSPHWHILEDWRPITKKLPHEDQVTGLH